ncbi:uncharacterized protein LOC107995825 isoform X1 [Apis cerana]|uniref:uncharacterized protein LOC107995825 isoform X1 n=2 Tax=Apis cerana TaxID=7461 RepID=UPI002B22C532|nr:uncharacterized protein LOC107995825 isoform X1 [Apis cerana]
MKMEDEISCDDPQFMTMLETCLLMEIETSKNTYSELVRQIKDFKVKVKMQLQTRKELKENTKNTQENILILSNSLSKERNYMIEISNKIELMKLNLDNDYKIMKVDCEFYENIYNNYEKVWESYHAKYEEFPLAKDRREAKIKMEKLQIEQMVLEYKVSELEKILKQKQRIAWLRMRAKIIVLARAISNYTRLAETLKDLDRNIDKRKEELNTIETELSMRLKKQEEEKRNRALKLLEMPPPKINFSHMRTIYGPRPGIGFPDGWKRNYENSIDTLSVDTLMLEEMCLTEENSIQPPSNTEVQAQKDLNLSYEEPIDSRNSSLDQEQQEVENEDVASEVDGNIGSEPIDAVEGEVEQRMGQELEHVDQSSGLSKDKQTDQRCKDLEKERDEPVAKKMKLISHSAEKPLASPMKGILLERTKSCSVEPSPRPRISRIETFHYTVPSIKKIEKIIPREIQIPLMNQSPGSIITKESSIRKLDQNNLNPSSMFTLHYDYSDNSEISFCIDENMTELKSDQITLYGGSVRNFCECPNLSPMNENINLEGNENVPSTSKTRNFSQFEKKFDFSNILKGSSNGKNLF